MPAEKVEIVTDNGTKVKAIAPVIGLGQPFDGHSGLLSEMVRIKI